MPSPFPGMDPFIESQLWEDFHATALPVIRELLLPQLPAGYKAYVQGRIYYSEDGPGVRRPRFQPDVTLSDRPVVSGERRNQGGLATMPQRATWSDLIEHHEAFVELREAATERVVTVLELLSPTNKRRRHKGRRVYLNKQTVPVVPATTLILYANNPRRLGDQLGLIRMDRQSSNVVIAAPRDPELVTSPALSDSDLPLAPLPQVLADLLTLPGRESLLADQLMDQLAESDPMWSAP